jgi:hypothetical protein
LKKVVTLNDFILRSNEIHNQKYDYSHVQLISTKIKVEILCPKHGLFYQTPSNHMKGQGCPTCGHLARKTSQRYSLQEFLKSLGNEQKKKYDYSEVKYLNSQTKIKVICPMHGAFEIKPNSHFNGQGCPKCGREIANIKIALPYSTFIERARKTHNNRYEYVQDSYNGLTKKMTIFCNDHGFFNQTPHSHISMKTGCPKCGRISSANSNKISWKYVLEKFKNVHGDFYTYDESSFKDVSTKMKIKCAKHGWFEQIPYQHYAKSGCPNCSKENNGILKRITFDEFIIKSSRKHNSKYSYENVNFTDIFTPIEIQCSKHGSFFQSPRNHYRGSGCSKCQASRGENLIRTILTNNTINFQEQKTFDDLFMKSKLKCDFYLVDYNIVVEYNGIQHYEPIELFGGVEGLMLTQKRDVFKYNYLQQNNIRLILIRYDLENVESYLLEEIKKIVG